MPSLVDENRSSFVEVASASQCRKGVLVLEGVVLVRRQSGCPELSGGFDDANGLANIALGDERVCCLRVDSTLRRQGTLW